MATTFKCPDGHDSTESDFCSDCGIELKSAQQSSVSAVVATPASAHEPCPKCNTARVLNAQFCEVCGYDYVNMRGGEVPNSEPAPVQAASQADSGSVSTPPSTGVASLAGIEIVVSFNPTVANAPKGQPPLTFPLFDEDNLIGRSNTKHKPTVALDDAAVSARHLLICRQDDSTYIARDVGSTNGTTLNGSTALNPGQDYPLKVGDSLALGEYTIITIKTIR